MNIEFPNFKRVVRGYEPEAVEEAWTQLKREIEEVSAANKELRLQVNSLREQNSELRTRLKDYEQVERDLRDAMIAAQRLAGQIREEAQTRAETQLAAAQAEAEAILQQAQTEAQAKLSSLTAETQDKEEEIAHLLEELSRLTTDKEGLQHRVTETLKFLAEAKAILNE
ncbi:MAG: DivIVA domain-containing protein [Desulfitobacteriaceae bacterium]|nr:DivIVA domain-containing protein [Desulfitobacteriaceae bacterium]MDI6878548.1 DivIVA domain-containing protein [Desulfitobacteriaceae bacterium]MDI6913981.1 DivIVA domain-containing protein [Desulfitobacteriaceae bacterium]